MARPATHDDLTKEQLSGPQVLSINMDKLPPSGPLLVALGELLNTVRRSGLTVTTGGYGDVTVNIRPAPEDLDTYLSAAQQEWDERAAQYAAAMVSGTEPEDYTKYTITAFACREHRPLPWEFQGKLD